MGGVRQTIGKIGTKAKAAASTSKERLGRILPSRSKDLDDPSSLARIARLDTKFFATPDRAIAADKTFGLIKLELQEAELQDEGSYFASVAIGEQTFASGTAEASSVPKWSAGRNLVLQRGEATLARISVFRTVPPGKGLRRSKPKRELVGWCDVDLASYFLDASGTATTSHTPDGRRVPDVDHDDSTGAKHPEQAASRDSGGAAAPSGGNDAPVSTWHQLKSPSDFSQSVGRIRVQTQSATLQHLERQFWGRALSIADLNADGSLELNEFRLLMQAFGTELSKDQIEGLYREADADGSNDVNEEELAACLARAHKDGELSTLIKRCPVSGAELVPGDDWGNLIYMTLCMDQGSGQTLQDSMDAGGTGGETWMLKMSEWAPQSLGGSMAATEAAVPQGDEGNFSHIIVYDRSSRRLVEEQISPTLVLAMRNMYQSRMGAVMMRTGAYNSLELMSKEEGRHMDSPDSVKNIPEFLKAFSGEVDTSEVLEPMESFKTFNEFFYRKLKPSARPIAAAEDAGVATSAADCRLSAFNNVSDATRCWIKGRKFSIPGLLADGTKAHRTSEPLAAEFEGGSMFIFRLAPQDYHRFHFPVAGTLRSIRHVRGKLYTVNPIAVASTYANVFTQNKRAVVMIDSPEFGPVAIVCIGATMVGSIRFTAEAGQTYKKGDELGYFAFGGSTVIALFGKHALRIDGDLLHNSARSLETLVKMGERLGCRPDSPFLRSESAEAEEIAELDSKTAQFAPIDQAMGGLSTADGAGKAPRRSLTRSTTTAIPINRHIEEPSDSGTSGSSSEADAEAEADEDAAMAAAAFDAAEVDAGGDALAAGPPKPLI